jgi:hypothetical protein
MNSMPKAETEPIRALLDTDHGTHHPCDLRSPILASSRHPTSHSHTAWTRIALLHANRASREIERGDVAAAAAALDRARSALRASATPSLRIAHDASTFQFADQAVVDLTRRAPLRRVLEYLAIQRSCCPGLAVSSDDLFHAGWPGERASAFSAAARVYTTIARLRRLGLLHVLLTHDDGYLLDPRVPLERC